MFGFSRPAALLGLLSVVALVAPARGSTIAYYRFENGAPGTTGGTVVDSSGNGLNGTANGPVYRTDVPRLHRARAAEQSVDGVFGPA